MPLWFEAQQDRYYAERYISTTGHFTTTATEDVAMFVQSGHTNAPFGMVRPCAASRAMEIRCTTTADLRGAKPTLRDAFKTETNEGQATRRRIP